jgi:3-(methylthio)propanoyl-CoA dehydrogenase
VTRPGAGIALPPTPSLTREGEPIPYPLLHMADTYSAPVRDMLFVLETVCDLEGLSRLEGYDHADPETVRGLLEEAGRFVSEVIAPLNRVGDRQGSRLVDGAVVTPDGFKEAYGSFVAAGWPGAHMPAEWGGGGLPRAVGVAIQEMVTSASMAFSLCPLLTQAGIEALAAHGTPEQQDTYLTKLVTGEWAGTMQLTEPQAGSDVGALTTKAIRQEDGTYRLFGTKIFITWGDHDMTGNIVHLVLARTPGAAPGTKGISLFLVPKFLLGPDGSLGARNDVEIVSLEHKMGIHASPTCVMSFGEGGDGALGYLIGEEQQGMRLMFTMMNNARLGVGIEGVAIAERAYQQALSFSQERRQGRATGATESSVIIEHPDVRRMLLTQKALIDAMRALLYYEASLLDLADRHPDPDVAARSAERADLFTPVAKAWCTDLGVELTSLALQVHGGMGYVEETGVAQYMRDSRIAPIYEGTNGIQAIDLVARKLPMSDGGVIDDLLEDIGSAVSGLREGGMSREAEALGAALAAVRDATAWLLGRRPEEPDDALAGATPYLKMLGLTIGGWLLGREALALPERPTEDGGWLEAKAATFSFYATQLLPQVTGLLPAVVAGAAPLFAIEPKYLAGG